MTLELNPGDAVPALLSNGTDEELPSLGATLEYTKRGVQLRIPFFTDYTTGEHFQRVTEWVDFSAQGKPEDFLVYTEIGHAHLFRNRLARTTTRGTATSTGIFEPVEVVFPSVSVDMPDELLVKRLRSEADGLLLFTGWRSWEAKTIHHEDGHLTKGIDIHVEGEQEVQWLQNEALMSLRITWTTAYPDGEDGRGGIGITDRMTLMSEFPDSSPTANHLREQKIFMDFLSVGVFGRALYFRHHEISDEAYASVIPALPREEEESFTYEPFHQLITRETSGDFERERTAQEALKGDSYLHLRQIPQPVLDGWADAWDKWQQFIVPLRSLLRRTPTVPDDFVVTGSIAFERASDVLGKQPGEEETYRDSGKTPKTIPTVATDIYRCLHQLGIDWSGLGTDEVGVARAIAWHYNGVKHVRGDTPEPEHLLLTAMVVRVAVRLFTLWIADQSGALLTTARAQDRIQKVAEHFKLYGFLLNDDGRFIPYPKSEDDDDDGQPSVGPES